MESYGTNSAHSSMIYIHGNNRLQHNLKRVYDVQLTFNKIFSDYKNRHVYVLVL